MNRIISYCTLFIFAVMLMHGCDGGPPNPTECIPDLISEWKFEESDGDRAEDTRGRNPGTFVGSPTLTDGRVGSAIEFRQIGQYVKWDGSDSFQFGTSSFTMEAWIQTALDVPSGTIYHIMGDYRAPPHYRLYITPDGVLGAEVAMADNRSTAESPNDVPTSITNGQWHHVAVVIDRENQKLIRYVNGRPYGDEKNITSQGSLNTVSRTFRVGQNGLDSGERNELNSFLGKIDEVRVYRRALNPEEVNQRHLRERC